MNYLLIQALPDHPYFIWQLYIQMQNFREWDIEDKAVIVVGVKKDPSPELEKFAKWTKAKVVCYLDTRIRRGYDPSIRPHLLKKYFHEFPTDCSFLYHDQDIIFLQKPMLQNLINSQYDYVAAAAKSYIDCAYLKSFRPYIFPSMCDIIDIDPAIIEARDANAGGAQYFLNNIKADFWEKCEFDCENLYCFLTEVNAMGLHRYNENFRTDKTQIQKWTTDMWVILWNLWLSGRQVRHAEHINFCWPYSNWTNAKPIFHNAGIVEANEVDANGNRFFNKSKYNGSQMPFGERFDFVSTEFTQRRYVDYIHKISI